MRTAIAFLTTEVKEQTITFAYQLSKLKEFDVFIISDEAPVKSMDQIKKIGNVTILRVFDSECKKRGYVNATSGTHIEKTPNAIDKFLYEFCESDKYSFVWLIEDDVFIPSVDAMLQLHNKSNLDDLVISKHVKKTDTVLDWHWGSIVGKIEKPWFRTMLCCAGFSRRMLNVIKQYVEKNKTLFNSEVMFGSLADHNNLRIFTPPELRTVLWRADFSLDDILSLPNNLYHPIKNLTRHEHLRDLTYIANDMRYEHVNKLPIFLKQ